MKIILSKKGLDSGCSTNPILCEYNKKMMFVPIPEKDGKLKYNSFLEGKNTLQNVLEYYIKNYDNAKFKFKNENKQIEKKSIKDCLNLGCHLDPQLENYFGKEFDGGFRASFGQSGRAQSYLKNCEVGIGDLFLFYGWYYDATNSQEQNIIFGYMQVGDILSFDKNGNVFSCAGKFENKKFTMYNGGRNNIEEMYPFLNNQPHWIRLKNNPEKYDNDVIYIAKEKCDFDGNIPGFGLFNYDKKLVLTEIKTKDKNRKKISKTNWLVEGLANCEVMRYKDKNGGNKKFDSNGDFLAPQGFGQELVIDCEKYCEAITWVKGLLKNK